MTNEVKEWTTSSFLNRHAEHETALIILNTPLVNLTLFKRIWHAASIRYCADGGANRLFDALHSPPAVDSNGRTEYVPNVIRGDLDSLRDDVMRYFRDHGSVIEHDPDQDSTDLGKCVTALQQLEKERGRTFELVLSGGLSGRLDQTAHTIHALTLLAQSRDRTWAIGRESLACVLSKGKHRLHIDPRPFGPTCAVLPFAGEAKVITKGQKWDLGPTAYMYPTSITSGVSSSNQMLGDTVEIETDVSIIWTVEVRDA